MDSTLRKSWWVHLLQGLVTALFGLATLTWPQITLFSLIVLFGAFAVAVGVSRLALSWRTRNESGWWLVLLSGIASVAAGILALAWPGLTALVLLFMIGAHALFAGVAAVWQSVRYGSAAKGRWLTLLIGIAAIVFGVLAFAWPGATALTLTWLIGIYALVFGVSEMVSSLVTKRAETKGATSRP